ncbi:hypothetical protein RRF57_011381 [Xylaria bambusicola]|uniref:Uncharacterized protein n=1 Tax=Xylaria bambusicola TaxID=326684 RepID=A0AAN7V2N3_9PEZI
MDLVIDAEPREISASGKLCRRLVIPLKLRKCDPQIQRYHEMTPGFVPGRRWRARVCGVWGWRGFEHDLPVPYIKVQVRPGSRYASDQYFLSTCYEFAGMT